MAAQPTSAKDLANPQTLVSLTKYLRLANYMGAAQLYLKANFFLEEELKPEHIKERILGHWGTVPGLNFIYANLNLLINRHQVNSMLVMGPGHGYPALLANMWIDGTWADYYPDYKWSKESFGKIIKSFSWPRGYPSHANPETPGVILEGGELGYSLVTAFGAAFDNPDLLVTCIVGDGEAETATMAASWHSNKFLNPKSDGAVLPIVHLNKFKISGPSIYGTMSDQELTTLFEGYGYHPIIVSGDFLYEPMIYAMEEAYQKIKQIQKDARENGKIDKPKWPVILLVTKKGWGCPPQSHGKMLEDSYRSHGIPLENPLKDPEEFELLKSWLKTYEVQELLTETGEPIAEIQSMIPAKELRVGNNKQANCDEMTTLDLPSIKDFEVPIGIPGQTKIPEMLGLANYLAEVTKRNPNSFRIMSPDESISNRLSPILDVTDRRYVWPFPAGAEKIGPDGRMMEILSENVLTGWMEGYTLTGRHAILFTYEAFMMIGASMVDQYLKFLAGKAKISWRKAVPSLTFVITSASWRQEHNGISHQNPGFVSSLLNNHSKHVEIHYPVDTNMLIGTMEGCLKSVNKVNVIVTGKYDQEQYLTMNDVEYQMRTGIGVWAGASKGSKNPDVVYAASGDYMTLECLAAIKYLNEWAPEINTRFVSVSEINNFNIGDLENPARASIERFEEYFTTDKPVIFAYHGYPEDIKALLFGNPHANRFHIHGYVEKGTTTTPFDMLVMNQMSRFQLALEGAYDYLLANPGFETKYKEIETIVRTLLAKHEVFITANGKDIPEVTEFKLVA